VCGPGSVDSDDSAAGVCGPGSVVSTENTYKYHMQVQENLTSSAGESTAQLTHSGPLKQLLKPTARKAHPTTSASQSSVSDHADDDQTQTSAEPADSQLSSDVVAAIR